ncbi:Peptidase S8 and S53, subtilisin, kexin, sedolisin [Trichormus variabilis ATCC 29413]|uniref:Peptidase S8 and S53, subtilisin, kexin, sedolisin n=2 Tax=Anabaena variabilis TaxID=264691 RepID=Q3M7A7_TRIV2|nr:MULTISPECIES: S8 family peptidase [Nostocaceae]ABA23129.1 Peptidase S8 and S53, subtilisin, kexin, sedolisin [Trichormus variabilis ATCC 29413]MBC1217387.1 peptidase S8 [Trichormus variabilis ARAD]MBC1257712.1 peptidase S8 [Trichormus variabilis V5]MBC1270065.1 peptidase S8 [Trichormus variabilis FSR]MBC1303228.1 peptidase S8 [Trichormus variabilis N2B]
MRRLILLCLFVIGLISAVFGFLSFQGLAAKGEFETILLDFREDIPAEVIKQDLQAIAQQYNVTPQLDNKFSEQDHVYIIKGDRQRLKALQKSSFAKATEIIEPNYIYKLTPPAKPVWLGEILGKEQRQEFNSSLIGPNDEYYSKQWNLHKIGIEGAWTQTKGSGVTVAVIDTGVTQVRDLKETKFVQGYDFVNDRVEATDDNGHGTHVAGTVAQATNNKYGVAGVAYEASLMPLKVLSAYGGGTVADIAEAIKFAADKGADVINMSLGGGGESQLLKDAINYAHNKGVVIIAAAGNENDSSASYPARYPHVIGVSAFGPDGEKAPYSNFGAGVDISAPGGSDAGAILQETINEEGEGVFLGLQGTSMAAPHVAGVAALIKASGVKEPDAILEVLKQSARVIQDDGLNYYGAGQLNAEAAVKLAAQGQISFQDFFRWLRDNGYLNPRFWFDGGAVALLPKILMVVGSYLLAWFLRVYLPFPWSWSLSSGLIFGSSGLFFLKGIYIFDLPQWPFRVLGSSIPELGNTLQGSNALNPVFASVLIPILLIALLLGHPSWKWFAIGSTLGVAACLTVSAVLDPAVWGLNDVNLARIFLIINALLCYALARLALKNEEKTA